MDRVVELLKESNALLEGHFLLSSGNHSDKYCQCAKLLQYPDKAEEVMKSLKRLNLILLLDLQWEE